MFNLNSVLLLLIIVYLFWRDYLGKHLKISKYSKEIDITWYYSFYRDGTPIVGNILYSFNYRRLGWLK